MGTFLLDALVNLTRRICSDCRVTSYKIAYSNFLRTARANGYNMLSLIECFDLFRTGAPFKPCLAIRHDVDINSVAGNQMFFEIERTNRATATYYFRLTTAMSHRAFIDQLLQAGFEVGYHFEEAATVAKRRHLKTSQAVFRCRKEIQERFMENCERFRHQYSPHMRWVSSHGDWINRRLKFSNRDLLDEQVLAKCGVDLEAYDSTFRGYFDLILSDVYSAPESWQGENDWINRLNGASARSVHLLAHERQWYPAPLVKNGENIKRLLESICYHMPLCRDSK